mmetsp:Transcript_8744/g.18746  ORF Transcript_8744/g.18746 Transcript_8744/m.18746 type:complete len:141 (+) Transcript_8744:245-667(+)
MGNTLAAAHSDIQHSKSQFRENAFENMLGPPSKTMDASEYAQELLMIVKRTIESHLNLLPIPGPKGHKFAAKQMIVRSVRGNAGGAGEEGKMYYIKARTDVGDWPWIFVKIHEPPTATGAMGVHFVSMKKMKEEYKLVTF